MRPELFRFLLVLACVFAGDLASAHSSFLGSCAEPETPLFKVDDALKLKMMVDYAALNAKGAEEQQKAVIAVESKPGHWEVLPAFVSQRGRSRRQSCEAPPLRIHFLKRDIQKRIEKKVQLGSQLEEIPLAEYYLAFRDEAVAETDFAPRHDGIFAELGEDLKLVTHCGASEWPFVGGKTESQQDERLHSEYYLNKVLGTLDVPLEEVRLTSISYFDPSGKPISTRPGFFREPRKALARRCGLATKPTPGVTPGVLDPEDDSSVFLTEFLHKFAYNADYALFTHNVHTFFDGKGRRVYAPYDFDLSGLVTNDYPKNPPTLEANIKDLDLFLKENDRAIVLEALERVLSREVRMRTIVSGSALPPQAKAKFTDWLTDSLAYMHAYSIALKSKKL